MEFTNGRNITNIKDHINVFFHDSRINLHSNIFDIPKGYKYASKCIDFEKSPLPKTHPRYNALVSNFLINDPEAFVNAYVKFRAYVGDTKAYINAKRVMYKNITSASPKIMHIQRAFIEPIMQIKYEGMSRPLGLNYDDLGRKHKWDIHIYNDGTYDKKDVDKRSATATFEDFKCSICGVTKEESIGKFDSRKIKLILHKLNDIELLFLYYQSRCPVSDLHEYKNGECVKCGIKSYMISIATVSSSKSPIEDDALIRYYDKYKPNFDDDNAKISGLSMSAINESNARVSADLESRSGIKKHEEAHKTKTHPTSTRVSSADVQWSRNYAPIVTLAKYVGIMPVQIDMIASMHGQKYSSLFSGTYAFIEPTDKNDYRIYILDTIVRNIISTYTDLHYGAMSPFNQNLLIKEMDVPRFEIDGFTEKYKKLNSATEYLTKLQPMLDTSPQKSIYFIIEYMCRILLEIAKIGIKQGKHIDHDMSYDARGAAKGAARKDIRTSARDKGTLSTHSRTSIVETVKRSEEIDRYRGVLLKFVEAHIMSIIYNEKFVCGPEAAGADVALDEVDETNGDVAQDIAEDVKITARDVMSLEGAEFGYDTNMDPA
jgi:hypothetical protein